MPLYFELVYVFIDIHNTCICGNYGGTNFNLTSTSAVVEDGSQIRY